MGFQMSALVFMFSAIAQMFVTSERLPFFGCMSKKAVTLKQQNSCIKGIRDITWEIRKKYWNILKKKINFILGRKSSVYISCLAEDRLSSYVTGSNVFKIETQGYLLSRSYEQTNVSQCLRVGKNLVFSQGSDHLHLLKMSFIGW